MNFHQILFSPEMIRANLEGRKTQTRRVCTFAVERDAHYRRRSVLLDKKLGMWLYRGILNDWPDGMGRAKKSYVEEFVLKCPYGVPGDILWARETWARGPGGSRECVYLATVNDGEHPPAWKPAIHMPKWACRLWCRVESVRVERVQDISEADAIAEGRSLTRDDPRGYFPDTWDKINGKRGFGWKANPWVWAITYTVLKEAPEGWAEYLRQKAA